MATALKPHFDGTISIGNVISVLTFVGIALGAWFTLEAQVQQNQKQVEYVHETVKAMPEAFIQRPEFEAEIKRLERIEDKLDRLITIQLERND